MRILIAINETIHVEKIFQFSQQFIKRTAEIPTFVKINDWRNRRGKDQNRTIEINRKTHDFQESIHNILGIDDFDAKLRIGKPEEEILNEIHDNDYNLVIFDDLGFKKLRIGLKKTIAQRVAERAFCSVLIVRGEIRPVRKILLCDSGAEESRLVNKFLSQVIDVLGKDEMPTVLHVMSQISAGPGVRGTQLRADAEELIVNNTPEGDLLKKDMDTLKEAGLQPAVKIRHGLVVDEIMAEAKTGDYDLVVIGTNRERWQHFLLDDLGQQLVKQLNRPILILK